MLYTRYQWIDVFQLVFKTLHHHNHLLTLSHLRKTPLLSIQKYLKTLVVNGVEKLHYKGLNLLPISVALKGSWRGQGT